MLTFLRKIRKSLIESGSTRKYLLYAIGEIILVVLGILIALQINNWNERNKDKSSEKNYYLNIIDDLDKDSIKLNSLETFYNNRRDQLDWILKEVRIARTNPDLNEFGKRTEPLYYVEDAVSYSAAFDAARSSGDFSKFKNKEIINDLNQYYADFKEVSDILSSSLRLVESQLEPLLTTIPKNYFSAESGSNVIAMQENSEFYNYMISLEDNRAIKFDLAAFLQKPQLESYLIGDLGRSFHALSIIKKRKGRISEIKKMILTYLDQI